MMRKECSEKTTGVKVVFHNPSRWAINGDHFVDEVTSLGTQAARYRLLSTFPEHTRPIP